MKSFAIAASLIFLGQTGVMAASCDSYPEGIGDNVTTTPEGIRILATAQASVPLDDTDLYIAGIREAELEAKSYIAKRIAGVELKTFCESSKSIETFISINSEGKSVDNETVKKTICGISESAETLIRGATILGSCYTPGKFVRVTVGVSPETIDTSRRLSSQMNEPVNRNSKNGYIKPQSGGKLNNVNGYSDYQRIYNF